MNHNSKCIHYIFARLYYICIYKNIIVICVSINLVILLQTDKKRRKMTIYHFANCLALAYTPYYLTYKYMGLSEYGAFWKVRI